jgi:hypothetical protein
MEKRREVTRWTPWGAPQKQRQQVLKDPIGLSDHDANKLYELFIPTALLPILPSIAEDVIDRS